LPEDSETGEVIWQNQVQISLHLEAILQKMVRYHWRDRISSASEILQQMEQLTSLFVPNQAGFATLQSKSSVLLHSFILLIVCGCEVNILVNKLIL
jgi:eukaryotic-like serine/threonine-protein kinase